jgi:hypothetical protein
MKKLLALVGLTVLGGSLGFLAAGCGSEKAVSLGPPAHTGSTAVTEPTGTVPTSVSLEAWFLRGEQLVRELRTHEATPLVATAAMRALLAGPTPAELESGLGTAIPAGTRLLGIAIKKGVATVDLTSDYQSGGGSLSMQARLGQVVYTLTQFPTVRRVRFHLDGEPVNVFSGEGIVLDHPVGRKDYEDLLPVIVVESPVEGARVTSPFRQRERLRGQRDREGARRERARSRQDLRHRDLWHRLPRHVLGARALRRRPRAARHDRGLGRRRRRDGHAAARRAGSRRARPPTVTLSER